MYCTTPVKFWFKVIFIAILSFPRFSYSLDGDVPSLWPQFSPLASQNFNFSMVDSDLSSTTDTQFFGAAELIWADSSHPAHKLARIFEENPESLPLSPALPLLLTEDLSEDEIIKQEIGTKLNISSKGQILERYLEIYKSVKKQENDRKIASALNLPVSRIMRLRNQLRKIGLLSDAEIRAIGGRKGILHAKRPPQKPVIAPHEEVVKSYLTSDQQERYNLISQKILSGHLPHKRLSTYQNIAFYLMRHTSVEEIATTLNMAVGSLSTYKSYLHHAGILTPSEALIRPRKRNFSEEWKN